jgi:isoleucyl-tRNA synthetase
MTLGNLLITLSEKVPASPALLRYRRGMPAASPVPAAPAGTPGSPDLPAIEREVLRRWRDRQVPERALRQAADGPRWTCYVAPRPASGVPGVHHLPALVLADALARFHSMRGTPVPRRAVWDCHGLAVEVAVERELGLAGRAGVEAYGVAPFTARCRESARRHAAAITRMAGRAGCWEDPAGTAATMDAGYVESVWWSLREAYRRGLLVRDLRVCPHCPRCETPLSGRELAQPGVWREVSDPSVILRLRLREAPAGAPAGTLPDVAGAHLLAWTTAPWTLVAAAAVAADPDRTYAVARRSGHGDRVVVADDRAARVLGEGWHVTGRLRGADLAGARYEPPLPLIDLPGAT